MVDTFPCNKIAKRFRSAAAAQNTKRELVVLFTTGAFCPIHVGHLELMEAAKRELPRRGCVVLGCLLVPDNDAYVTSKCGAAAMPAASGVEDCEEMVSQSDWLAVDRSSAMHAPAPLNFTAIADRISINLAWAVPGHQPIRVTYCFGSDNARFSAAFAGRGSGVCLQRPGCEAEFEEAAADTVVRKSGLVVFVHDKMSCTSSTYVRQRRSEAPPLALEQNKPYTLAPDPPAEDVDRTTLSKLAVDFYLRREGG
jgi:nicotinic acid mononucleotide adenylyltransferase